MKQSASSERARAGQHVIMGPWAHGAMLPNFVGTMHHGMMGGAQGMLLSDQHIKFYDRYLKGVDSVIPAIRYFVMGRGQWRTAEVWPLPQTQWRRYYLHSRGRAHTASGNGTLALEEPGDEPPDVYVYNPLTPTPSIGGRVVTGQSGFVAGPIEQSPLMFRPDVLCYTTAELKEDTEVTGPVKLHLSAATTVRDTDFAAILMDVLPDGRAYNIADGILRARFRKSVFAPEMLSPGQVYELTVHLGETSYLFRRGHRLRLTVSSSNFPAYDRNMNTGNPIGEDAQGTPAMQTVFHETGNASYLELPVIAGVQ